MAQELAHHRVIMHGEGNHEPPSPSEVQAWTINGCWGGGEQVALVQANNLLPTLNKKTRIQPSGVAHKKEA